jgi:hypothetical protein
MSIGTGPAHKAQKLAPKMDALAAKLPPMPTGMLCTGVLRPPPPSVTPAVQLGTCDRHGDEHSRADCQRLKHDVDQWCATPDECPECGGPFHGPTPIILTPEEREVLEWVFDHESDRRGGVLRALLARAGIEVLP